MCVMCVMCDVFVGDEPRASWPSRGLRRVPPLFGWRLAVSGYSGRQWDNDDT